MCGLVLLVNKNKNGFTNEQQDVFETLLFIDTLRGADSTGVFAVDNIGNVMLAKEASMAPNFMREAEYLSVRNAAYQRGWAMVGHNRKATRGVVSDKNAHPFVVDDNIVLVHNGSYFGDHKSLKDVDVDSEAIAHTISEASSPEEALRKVNAAFALIWYNVEKKQIHAIRNSQRPLWYMSTDDSHIFASEEAFLQLVKYKFNLKLTIEPLEIKEYELSTYTLNEDKSTSAEYTEIDCSYHKHNKQTDAVVVHGFKSAYEWQQEELACAYGCDVPWLGKPEKGWPFSGVHTPVKTTNVINTKSSEVQKKFMDAILHKHHPLKYSQFLSLKDDFKDGEKTKVIVNDLIEADDNPKSTDWLMVAQTLGNHRVHATFHLAESNFQKIIADTNGAVYEIEINGLTWKRLESQKTDGNMDDWEGIVILHGKNPKAVFVEEPRHAS